MPERLKQTALLICKKRKKISIPCEEAAGWAFRAMVIARVWREIFLVPWDESLKHIVMVDWCEDVV